MRRKDREMPRDFAERVIDTCVFAVLATVNLDGTPYCVPLSIVREGEWIYFHGAREGRKIENLKAMNRVCLSCVGKTGIPERKFTVEYESAVVCGTVQEVLEDTEKIHGLRLLCLRHTPNNMQAFDDALSRHLRVTGVWKVHIDELTGKRHRLDKTGEVPQYPQGEIPEF
ncbi:MAG: pyridoxamine 5'-phosphate oxidase family protein [Treponema sp.]|jgi:nitroimidazol reductase NimA-like FMN-containing flavoprotein (pyridoxamine 5'-phosphate oxidase superfamily)|nr:pyridoxamine 5'-phosphate oxidase family protein [Treponema sp.]